MCQALDAAVAVCKAGAPMKLIGDAVCDVAEREGAKSHSELSADRRPQSSFSHTLTHYVLRMTVCTVGCCIAQVMVWSKRLSGMVLASSSMAHHRFQRHGVPELQCAQAD
eukprot:5842543-Amphidinium_carterae.1